MSRHRTVSVAVVARDYHISHQAAGRKVREEVSKGHLKATKTKDTEKGHWQIDAESYHEYKGKKPEIPEES